jgi:hypothetical protein
MPFTLSSILFRPQQKHIIHCDDALLVEAPGTAPGSEKFITTAIYRHSRFRQIEYMAIRP